MTSCEWSFAVREARGMPGVFLAWCAKTTELGSGPLDVELKFDVHAAFGETAKDALSKLKREVFN